MNGTACWASLVELQNPFPYDYPVAHVEIHTQSLSLVDRNSSVELRKGIGGDGYFSIVNEISAREQRPQREDSR
jgi:hypothetical protein